MNPPNDSLTLPRYIRRRTPARKAARVMIHSVKISGYRAFDKFEMHGLGRVNLLVGKNNTGKTSLLEALYFLGSRGEPNALWRMMGGRGETITTDQSTRLNLGQPEIDVGHLFSGHALKLNATATITTKNQSPERSITFKVDEANPSENPALYAQAQMPLVLDNVGGQRFSLRVLGTPEPIAPLIPLSSRNGLRAEVINVLTNIAAQTKKSEITLPQFLATGSSAWNDLTGIFNEINLGPFHSRMVGALQMLDPNIENIGPSNSGMHGWFQQRAGFKIKLKNIDEPIPIGSMGEGIWRILALAMVLSRAKDNLLLVDEIDTGLHHTVMTNMWKFMLGAARDLNVQVFATTHSQDCVYSLAKVCRDISDRESEISIQRIEAGRSSSIPYSEADILVAAERHIEIR